MNCLQFNARGTAKGRLEVGAVLSAMLAGVALGVFGCSSNSTDSTTKTNSTPDASTASDAGSVLSSGDKYGACTDSAPLEPPADLNGLWAVRIIASRFVPATGLTAEFYTRTIGVLLSSQTQTGSDVNFDAKFCHQYAEDDAGSMAHVVIPQSYVDALKPFVRPGTYSTATAGVAMLQLPLFPQVQGAVLADPLNDPMPTEASDPTVFDQDNDGNPGITIKLSGIVTGDLYVVQRQKDELTGIAVSNDRVVGKYDYTSEQNVLASNPSTLRVLASQPAVTDSRPCTSTFTMIRVASTWTCADVLANSTLFD